MKEVTPYQKENAAYLPFLNKKVEVHLLTKNGWTGILKRLPQDHIILESEGREIVIPKHSISYMYLSTEKEV